ncbi:hypothetical protein ABB37_03279 [Leptomonas pyrrhocoris]|uniref:Uncharacterized protein n=1 Tax=Leptomonas pyrrhocoris TaxID=157538 RepID=A0A0M9G4K8_LEPPY|nr:hypothetical protein ABB37_03279 [Leptomonas pyrrhocoris]KPA82143.1 hypothetical protein ABB37_03279 [Leptomonas pyrrhocoris]|eukprot:XP_015660582.1 hypothetical protein ABB37_03279 [Leptomonas pyrrhocoris]
MLASRKAALCPSGTTLFLQAMPIAQPGGWTPQEGPAYLFPPSPLPHADPSVQACPSIRADVEGAAEVAMMMWEPSTWAMHKSVVRRYLEYLQHHQAPATPSTVAAFLYTLDISPSSALQYYGILHRFLTKPLDLGQMFAKALRKMKAMTPIHQATPMTFEHYQEILQAIPNERDAVMF